MAHTLYENFVLENKITNDVNTKLDVNSLFTVDNSLATDAGLTKYINKYTYTGEVEKLEKGAKNADGTKGSVAYVQVPYTVERYQHTFTYNDMDVMQDPYFLDVATNGAAITMSDKIRAQYFEELAKIAQPDEGEEPAPNYVEVDALTYDAVVDALAAIGKEVETDMFIVMGLDGRKAIRKDADFKSSRQGEILYTGQFGTIAGVPCLFSKLVPEKTAYITAKDQVKLFVKKDGSVEQDRDIETKDNTVVYERHGVMALVDETKSAKIVFA